jgi:hypothetical protein
MTPPLPALRDFSDRLSPMVVKEMRQGLRTRFFTAALILFHLVLGCLMLSYLFDVNQRDTKEVFWLVIIVTLLGVLPSRAFNALNAEVKDGTLDMLMLTGITSFRIVWGKWVSLYSQTLLVASSLLPYMIVRYQFGGVEIAREVLALAALVVGSGLVTAALVGFSSQRQMFPRLITAAVVGLGAFAVGAFAGVLACEDYEAEEIMTKLSAMGVTQVTLIFSSITLLTVYLGYARLSGMGDSQQALKRKVGLIVLSFLTLVSLWIGFVRPWGLTQNEAEKIIEIAVMFPALLICLLLSMDLSSESVPEVESRFAAQAVKVNWFTPGWPMGVLLSLALWAMTFLIHLCMCKIAGRWYQQGWFLIASFMAASVMPVCLPRRWLASFSLLSRWWLLQACLVVLAIVLLAGTEAMHYEEGYLFGYFGVMTPLAGLPLSLSLPWGHREVICAFGLYTHGHWIFLSTFISLRALFHQTRRSPSGAPFSSQDSHA